MKLVIKLEIENKEETIVYELIDGSNGAKSVSYLANNKKYDGLEVRRIVKDFVIQAVYEEEKLDKYFNYEVNLEKAKIRKYDLCLAGDKVISSGSCWFITLSNEASNKLSYFFTPIAHLVSGEEVIKKLENLEVKDVQINIPRVIIREPINKVIINSIRSELEVNLDDFEIIGGNDVLK